VVLGACLRAFGGVGGIGEGSARAWVLTIVRDTAYTWLHKNRPSAAPAIEDLEDVEAAAAIPRGSQSKTPGAARIAKVDTTPLDTDVDLAWAFSSITHVSLNASIAVAAIVPVSDIEHSQGCGV
jgi:hypothetical protein